jgi:hypothetical protein
MVWTTGSGADSVQEKMLEAVGHTGLMLPGEVRAE